VPPAPQGISNELYCDSLLHLRAIHPDALENERLARVHHALTPPSANDGMYLLSSCFAPDDIVGAEIGKRFYSLVCGLANLDAISNMVFVPAVSGGGWVLTKLLVGANRQASEEFDQVQAIL
jgi:hypothetical protein